MPYKTREVTLGASLSKQVDAMLEVRELRFTELVRRLLEEEVTRWSYTPQATNSKPTVEEPLPRGTGRPRDDATTKRGKRLYELLGQKFQTFLETAAPREFGGNPADIEAKYAPVRQQVEDAFRRGDWAFICRFWDKRGWDQAPRLFEVEGHE